MARRIKGLPLEDLRAMQIKAQEEFHLRRAKMPYLKKVRLVGRMQGMVKMWKEAKVEPGPSPISREAGHRGSQDG